MDREHEAKKRPKEYY